jgi:RHS repeat-associated protein
MQMVGRTYSAKSYRYGFNGQEKSDEIRGDGNSYTAAFWEYDPRIGRRWNLDPIYNTDISRYAVNGNNPNYYLDPKGDFKTKFGAKVYKFFHGGKIGQSKSGSRAGEWYVSKKLEDLQGKKGGGKQADGSTELDEVVVGVKLNYSWGKNNPGNMVDKTADGVDRSVNYIKNNASDIWNSTAARAIIPDYYTLSVNGSVSAFITGDEELTLTLMTRGKDPGLYFNTTTNMGWVTSVGADVGCSVGRGYYIGDARQLSSKMLGGWQGSGIVGVGVKAIAGGSVNGAVDVGFDDNGKPTTITGKVGFSVGVGVSTPILQVGSSAGYATPAIPLKKL